MNHLFASIRKTLYEIRHNLKVSWLVFPALFLQSFVIGLLSPVITLYVQNELHLSPNMYSLLLIAGGGITVLAIIPCGKLVDRFGTAPFLNAGFLLAAISLIMFSAVRSLPVVFATVGVVGISYAMILPAWNTFVSTHVPKGERGAVWGFSSPSRARAWLSGRSFQVSSGTVSGIRCLLSPAASSWPCCL